MKKIIIIGGGIAGLSAAVRIKAKALEQRREIVVELLEKSGTVGGKILTEKVGDVLIEGGPDCFLPEKYWTVDLARFLHLENEMVPTNDRFKGTFIYSKKKLHPLPEGVMLMVPTMIMPLATASLISWPGKIRMGLELFIPKRKNPGDENLASFVTRRLGKECLDKIAEPLVAGIHTSNPDNMSVLATFPRFVELEQKYGSMIRGMVTAIKNRPVPSLGPSKKTGTAKMTYFMSFRTGMSLLPEACADFIGASSIRCNTTVTGIEPAPSGYRVHLADGTTLSADSVISAAPAYSTSPLIEDFDKTLATQLSEIKWSSSATVSMAFHRDDIKAPLKGFGFIVPKLEKRRINAATYSSIKFSRRAPDDMLLMRAFIGGGNREELVGGLDDGEMKQMVLEEIDTIAGIRAEPLLTKTYRWFDGMPKYTVGHLDRMAQLDKTLSRHPGLYLIGSSYRGIGIGDCINRAQMAADGAMKELEKL